MSAPGIVVLTALAAAQAVFAPPAPPPAPPAPPVQPRPSRDLSTLWIVEPTPEAAGRELSLKGGELVLKQPLIPAGLARLTGAANDPKGKFALAPGAELFQVQSDVPVYCLAGKRAPAGVVTWLVGGGGRGFLCLVDADRDGRFEGQFLTGSATSGMPTIAGKRPKQADPLTAPAAFAVADPRTAATKYWVGIEYQGKPLLYNRRNFAVSFGNDDDKGSLTDWVYTGGSFPASQQLLGAKWTVLALEGDRLKVRIDRPIPAQPFGVVQTVTYRIY